MKDNNYYTIVMIENDLGDYTLFMVTNLTKTEKRELIAKPELAFWDDTRYIPMKTNTRIVGGGWVRFLKISERREVSFSEN